MMFAHFYKAFYHVPATLTVDKKMRFCPKCSLKIKANIEQCPICKVELLFCAEDEDVTAHLSQKGDPQQKVTEKSPAPPSHTAPPAQEPTTPAPVKPDTMQSSALPPTEDLAVLTRKLKSLEDHLVHIEKTIEINSTKDDIIRSSIVDLESKITKLDKALADLESFPHDRLEKIEAEIAHLSSNSTSVNQDLGNKETTSTPLESPPEIPAPSDERIPFSDFSSRDTSFPEGEISFAGDTQDDFERTFVASIEDQPSVRERKRKLPIVLPLIALLLIAVWLVFYYSKPREEDMQETVVSENIILPTPPKTTEGQPAKNSSVISADSGKIAEEKGAALTTLPPDKKASKTAQKTPSAAQPSLNGSGYTVNVGSFKDKTLALTLTTRLQEKGYSALISPSKDKQFYRVKVGAFSTQKEARAYASVLEKKEKLPTLVTQINQP